MPKYQHISSFLQCRWHAMLSCWRHCAMHCKSELMSKEKQHDDCAYMLVPSDVTQGMPHEERECAAVDLCSAQKPIAPFSGPVITIWIKKYICGQWFFFWGVNGGGEDPPPDFFFFIYRWPWNDLMTQVLHDVLHCRRKKGTPLVANALFSARQATAPRGQWFCWTVIWCNTQRN